MIHSSLALLGAAVIAASPVAPAAARRVAVLDFAASWSGECVAGAKLSQGRREECEVLRLFADQSRGAALAVLRPPAYVVMTRENTAQILKDMGGVCSEGECEVETARLLGASVVVSGEVALLEGTYIVSLKVHDVTSAALLGTASTQARTKLEAFGNVRAETERMLKAAVGLDGAVQVAATPVKPPPPKKADPEGALALDVRSKDAVADGGTKAAPPVVERRAAVQAPPPGGVRSMSRRWYAEIAPSFSSPLVFPHSRSGTSVVEQNVRGNLGALVRAGYRLNNTWAFDAAVGTFAARWEVKNPLGSFGEKDVWFEYLVLGGGASWFPEGNRYFSLGADVGIARWQFEVRDAGPRDGTGTPFGLLEARLDYPLGSLAFGLRLGLLAMHPGEAEYSSLFSPGENLVLGADWMIAAPASLVVQYRF